MMFPTSLSEYFKMSSQAPVFGLTAPAKYAITAAAAAGAGALIFGGAKQYMNLKQTGSSEASQTFYITPKEGATVNIIEPSAAASTEQKQEAAQTQPDYLQWLLIGGLALGAIYLFTKRRK